MPRDLLIRGGFSGREKSNRLIRVTRNTWVSMRLSPGASQELGQSQRVRKKSVAYANLHPMQLLCPPEKEALYSGRLSIWWEGGRTTTLQIPIYPECCFGFLVHLKPTIWSEYIGIGTPYVAVPTK